MFFLVDIIQKKSGTRNIVELSGFAMKFPTIKILI
jgi:NADH:ubiquinone oxidoreductase subunit 4 (subunit M)